jgi:hypothetical protein
MTAAQYSFPSCVGCSVISVIHNRFVDHELAVDQVDGRLRAWVAHGAAAPSPPVEALDPGVAHQPGDPLDVHRHAEPEHELGMHPR